MSDPFKISKLRIFILFLSDSLVIKIHGTIYSDALAG